MKKYFNFLLLVLSLSVFFNVISARPAAAAGASLYLAPSAKTVVIDTKFSVSVKINTGGQSVNAAQASLSFDKSLLKVTGVSKGGSVFSLWAEEPSFSNSAGTIVFGGGVPRPGYTGSGGTVVVINFQAIKSGTAQVNFTSGSVLANDGLGTNILSSMGNGSFTISPKTAAPEEPKPLEAKPEEPKPVEEPKEKTTFIRPEVTSPSHPNQEKWYRERLVKLAWKLPEGVEGVSVAFDQKAFSNPGDSSDGLFDAKEYPAESDGLWYFHIKFKNKSGWGTVANYKAKIDSTPPEKFTPEIKQEDVNDWPTLFFKTTDSLSGMDHYSIVVNSLSSEPTVVSADKNSLKLSGLEAIKHAVLVKAVDRAGNETVETIEFELKPIAEPKVENYSQEFSPDDKFFASGTAIPGTTVTVFVKKEGEDKLRSYKADTDQSGNWSLVASDSFSNGRYVFWTEAANSNGIKSKAGPRSSFLVTPPVFARIGSMVIDYFTVIVSLIFMIVLTVFLLLLIFWFIKKRLRKETIEIEEVLEKNMEILRQSINDEISALGKLNKTEFTSEKTQMKKRLEGMIDETNRRILKEVKDVEKILK